MSEQFRLDFERKTDEEVAEEYRSKIGYPARVGMTREAMESAIADPSSELSRLELLRQEEDRADRDAPYGGPKKARR